MKVCVFGTRGFPLIQGGVEKHCELLYPLLNSDYKFIIFRRRPYVHTLKKYANIKFIDLPSTRIKGFETIIHSLLATIVSLFFRPDIIHIHNIGPAFFAPLLRVFGMKVVLTYHSPNYEHKKWGKMAQKLLRLSETIALHFSNEIIFVNKFQMEKYSKKVQRKSYYIPNGIPDVVPTSSTTYISALGLKPNKYIIGVGRITQEKGFDILIQAFEKTDTDFKLVIVGGVESESNYLLKLKNLIKSNRIIFTDYIYGKKLCEIYSHAALYVLSSYNEGFPLVLLEAMKYGLDVLVSDIPATHLVKLNRQDYFEKGNIDDLTWKLQSKIQKHQKREYELSEYNWNIIARQVSMVYQHT